MKRLLGIPDTHHFTIHNIPFGVGTIKGTKSAVCATRIGDNVVNLQELESLNVFSDLYPEKLFDAPFLNKFLSTEKPTWKAVRERIQNLFGESSTFSKKYSEEIKRCVVSEENFVSTLPASFNNYCDFYSSYNHAYNVGVIFRGVFNALPQNWLQMPIAYNGRVSSIRVNHDLIRPYGQRLSPETQAPVFGLCQKLDYELEVGYVIGGKANDLGSPIAAKDAMDRVFGIVLLNDWSARDIQLWEIQPLGPFTSKNLLTTISPWIVTLDALEPFKTKIPERKQTVFEYLDGEFYTYDIPLVTRLKPSEGETEVISVSNLKHMYWSVAQQIAHLTITGTNLMPADILGSGTISGPDDGTSGCLLEITKDNKQPLKLKNGVERGYLKDGDVVSLEGINSKDGITVGLGNCTSMVVPNPKK